MTKIRKILLLLFAFFAILILILLPIYLIIKYKKYKNKKEENNKRSDKKDNSDNISEKNSKIIKFFKKYFATNNEINNKTELLAENQNVTLKFVQNEIFEKIKQMNKSLLYVGNVFQPLENAQNITSAIETIKEAMVMYKSNLKNINHDMIFQCEKDIEKLEKAFVFLLIKLMNDGTGDIAGIFKEIENIAKIVMSSYKTVGQTKIKYY